MNGKLKRNLSTVEDREWWESVAEAAKHAPPKLELHQDDVARYQERQQKSAEEQARSPSD